LLVGAQSYVNGRRTKEGGKKAGEDSGKTLSKGRNMRGGGVGGGSAPKYIVGAKQDGTEKTEK